MKTKLTLTIGALATVVTASGLVSLYANDHDKEKYSAHGGLVRERLGEVFKVTDVMGKEVENLKGEKLGKLEEVAVDVANGRVVYVILSADQAGKATDKNVAVASRSIEWSPTHKVLRLDVSQEKVKSAPAFDLSQWDDLSRSNRIVGIYGYYDLRPYFLEQNEGKRRVPPTTPLGHVTRASKVVGMAVRNHQDEKLGSVDNLMVNLERGRIAHVIVSSGGFLGIGDELSVMPPTAFRYDNAKEVLRIDATKDDLARAPHFKNSEWPNLNDPQYAGAVYRAYRVEPYFDTDVDADNTRRNARDREGSSPTPVDQGTSKADRDTTQSIRQQLVAQENLSINARNVRIITMDGRVTLRGPVNSEEEKRLVAGIAARTVSPDRINNQLEVKREIN